MIIFDANRNSNNSDRTIMVEPEVLQSITGELASVTDKNETTLLPNDLGNTLGTMETILRWLLVINICYENIWLFKNIHIKN